MPTDRMIAEKADGIGWMIFNNPERHNAVSLDMWEAAIDMRLCENVDFEGAGRRIVSWTAD